MPNDELFDLDIYGMQAQIERLAAALERMDERVREGAEQAALESAQIIMREQKRMLSAAFFSKPTTNLAGLIQITRDRRSKYFKLRIGYDSEAVRQHPEVLVIEFGRPGKSARRMKPTDKLGRKKGAFPPYTPHIIAGFSFAKEDAAKHFRDRLAQIAQNEWQNGG